MRSKRAAEFVVKLSCSYRVCRLDPPPPPLPPTHLFPRRCRLVLNAKAAGQRLGLDPYALEAEWRKAKGDDLIKFGGGFYCAKMQDGDAP